MPPGRPWTPGDILRVVEAASALGGVAETAGGLGGVVEAAGGPGGVVEGVGGLGRGGRLPSDHPRLGGWVGIDDDSVAGLRRHAPWAAGDLTRLQALERDGLAAARGGSLVHGDLYPHNILLTADRVVFVDWPHARLGSPTVDLVAFLSSVAADGLDPEPFVPEDAVAVTEVLAAHTGFLLAGGLAAPPPGLEAIAAAKLRLGIGALGWLRRRLRVEVSADAPGPDGTTA
ncbi:phosphotransferase [Dactylosporangium sp. NPDC005555]|uniref:phosphotransferase n=1 Tax=Dactylosporangium sp. NPDC005555 TaxID=3154889 RepID=UPI0033AC2AA5